MRFLLIDRIVELEPGSRARGFRLLRPEADYYLDHMPGYPIEPAALILESMAQLGGRLVQRSVEVARGEEVLPMVASVSGAEFKRPARPGDRLDLTATVMSIRSTGARVQATAAVDGRDVAAARITYVLVGSANNVIGIGTDELNQVREWGRETWAKLVQDVATRK